MSFYISPDILGNLSIYPENSAEDVPTAETIFIETDIHTTPASGNIKLYAKTDGEFYKKNSTGVETVLAGGAANALISPPTNSDNAIVVFNGVNSKIAQNSTFLIDDNDLRVADDATIKLNSTGAERIRFNAAYTSIKTPDGAQTAFETTGAGTTLGAPNGNTGVGVFDDGTNIYSQGSTRLSTSAGDTVLYSPNGFNNVLTATNTETKLKAGNQFFAEADASSTQIKANNNALLTGTSIATTLSTNGAQWAKANTDSQVVLGFPSGDPNETLTVNEDSNLKAAISIEEKGAPTLTPGYGKIYASSADNKLHFLNSSGVDSAVGDLSSSSTSTNNSICTFDGTTGKVIQQNGASTSMTLSSNGLALTFNASSPSIYANSQEVMRFDTSNTTLYGPSGDGVQLLSGQTVLRLGLITGLQFTTSETTIKANDNLLLVGTSIATTLSTNGIQWAKANTDSQVVLGFPSGDPNETLTVNEDSNLKAAISIEEKGAPTLTAGYGKIYASSVDSKLHFLDSSGVDSALGAGISSSSTPVVNRKLVMYDGTTGDSVQEADITLSATSNQIFFNASGLEFIVGAKERFRFGSDHMWIWPNGNSSLTEIFLNDSSIVMEAGTSQVFYATAANTTISANGGDLLKGTSLATTLSTDGTQWAKANTSSQVILGFPGDDPNETLTVNEDSNFKAAISIQEKGAPALTSGYGKIYASSVDNKLHFLNSSGVDLAVEAGITNADGSSSDNAIVRFDGVTGDIIQDSTITIDDSDNIADVRSITGKLNTNLDLNGSGNGEIHLNYLSGDKALAVQGASSGLTVWDDSGDLFLKTKAHEIYASNAIKSVGCYPAMTAIYGSDGAGGYNHKINTGSGYISLFDPDGVTVAVRVDGTKTSLSFSGDDRVYADATSTRINDEGGTTRLDVTNAMTTISNDLTLSNVFSPNDTSIVYQPIGNGAVQLNYNTDNQGVDPSPTTAITTSNTSGGTQIFDPSGELFLKAGASHELWASTLVKSLACNTNATIVFGPDGAGGYRQKIRANGVEVIIYDPDGLNEAILVADSKTVISAGGNDRLYADASSTRINDQNGATKIDVVDTGVTIDSLIVSNDLNFPGDISVTKNGADVLITDSNELYLTHNTNTGTSLYTTPGYTTTTAGAGMNVRGFEHVIVGSTENPNALYADETAVIMQCKRSGDGASTNRMAFFDDRTELYTKDGNAGVLINDNGIFLQKGDHARLGGLFYTQLARRVGASNSTIVNLFVSSPVISPANLIDTTSIRIKGSGFVYATGTLAQLTMDIYATDSVTSTRTLLGSCLANVKASDVPAYMPADLDICLTLIGTSFLPAGQFNYVSRVSGALGTMIMHTGQFRMPYIESSTPPTETASKSLPLLTANFQTLSIESSWNQASVGLIISSLKLYFE